MKTEIFVTSKFRNEAKIFLKKYRSLKTELESLYLQLLENPQIGVPIKKNVFKIRLSVQSKGKGKSGGLRVITYLQVNLIFDEKRNKVYLLSIYDKSETESISDSDIEALIKLI